MPKPAAFQVNRLSAKDHIGPGPLPVDVRYWTLERMVSPHAHDFFELVLVTQGRAEHITSRRRTLTVPGDLWFIRPGHWHTYMNPRKLGLFNCLLAPNFFRALTPELQRVPGAVELFWRGPATQARDGCFLLRLNAVQREDAARLLRGLEEDRTSRGPAASLRSRGRFFLFLALVSEAAQAQTGQGAEIPAAEISRTTAAAEAVEILEARYAENLTVAGLAKSVNLSVPHFNRLFRRMTGQSPRTYLAGVRIQRACLLLSESERPVTEIAGAVGWPDPNLFARRFKAVLGCSPREYRQERAKLGPRD
jgi:AraC-like DNA-binding protein